MTARDEIIHYSLTFPHTVEAYSFHDPNRLPLPIRTTIPDDDIQRMIAESYDLCAKK